MANAYVKNLRSGWKKGRKITERIYFIRFHWFQPLKTFLHLDFLILKILCALSLKQCKQLPSFYYFYWLSVLFPSLFVKKASFFLCVENSENANANRNYLTTYFNQIFAFFSSIVWKKTKSKKIKKRCRCYTSIVWVMSLLLF